jgi:hypothetical protein
MFPLCYIQPGSSQHTLNTFDVESGAQIAEEAAKCYALTGPHPKTPKPFTLNSKPLTSKP